MKTVHLLLRFRRRLKAKKKVTVTDDEARKSTIYRVVFATTKTGDNGQTTEMSKKREKGRESKSRKKLSKKSRAARRQLRKLPKEQNYSNNR